MILTPRFVFLHLHKSGTAVNEFLLRFIPDARQIGYHLPRSHAPPAVGGLPALGVVRNPWAWYHSWFTFQKQHPRPNPLFRLMSDGGQLDFPATLQNLMSLGGTSPWRFDELLAQLPVAFTGRDLDLPSFALARIRGSGLGFYSYLARYMFDGPGIMHVGRREQLRADLPRMLVSVGQDLTPSMRQHIDTAPGFEAPAGDYRTAYDDASRSLVERLDAPMIAKYGYRFAD